MNKKKMSIITLSILIITGLILSSYQIFAHRKRDNSNDNRSHFNRDNHKRHNKSETPKQKSTTTPAATPKSTSKTTPTASNSVKPTTNIPVSGKLDKNTQLYNLAWSNTGKSEKTVVPAVGNNNIVLLDCDDDASLVAKYKKQGYQVAGYISVGSWEDWRTDKSSFPSGVFGSAYDGWEGETWFIVAKWRELIPGMNKRMSKIREKGFQLVEFDNIEFAKGNKSDMIAYALELSNVAKSNSLLPLFKNGADLINQDSRIKDAYSGFIIEEAFEYNETNTFANLNKPTWFFEYNSVNKSKVQSWMTNVWYDTSSGWQKIK